MSSKFSESVEAQIIGTIIGGVILLAPAAIFAGAAPLLTAAVGQWATYLLELFLGSATFLFTVVASYYFYVVLPGGKEPAGSLEYERYAALRNDLARGGTAARIYSEKLTKALNAVDIFFQDAGTPGQRAFILDTPAPLWTAASFERCLLLALIYPVAMILPIWAVSGEVGPAEGALGLPLDLPGWQRWLTVTALAVMALAYWRSQRTRGLRAVAWFLFAVAAGVPAAVSLQSAGPAAVGGGIAGTGTLVGAVAGSIIITALGGFIGLWLPLSLCQVLAPLLAMSLGGAAGPTGSHICFSSPERARRQRLSRAERRILGSVAPNV